MWALPNVIGALSGDLCKQQKVRELYVFGSVLTDKFNDNSNIDILEYFNNYMDFK